jgi:dTDP-4-dehydrorhamnose reductase
MNPNKIIVTGSSGMLATDLIPFIKQRNCNVLGIDLNSNSDTTDVVMDITNMKLVLDLFDKYKPTVVIHLAAMTDVDACERFHKKAYTANTLSTQIIAEACAQYNTTIVYLSTASVFAGDKSEGYIETDIPNPQNYYAETKLLGEQIILQSKKHLIVRAGWMFGGKQKDKKFVGNILNQLSITNEIRAVIDKTGTLTYTRDIAQVVLELLMQYPLGVYHCANEGHASRFEIAEEIIKILQIEEKKVIPVNSDYFKSIASRPRYECLQNFNLYQNGHIKLPHWKTSMAYYITDQKNIL